MRTSALLFLASQRRVLMMESYLVLLINYYSPHQNQLY